MDSFRNDYVSINQNGIEILRNNFPIAHYEFTSIKNVEIYNGYLLKNNYLVLCIGAGLIIVALKLLFFEFEGLSSFDGFVISMSFIKILVLPLFLVLFSVYCIIQSLKRSKILKIELESQEHHIRIYEFQKQGSLEDLIKFLDKNVKLQLNY